jgi:hypothetical protein
MEIFAKDFSPQVAKQALAYPAVATAPGGKAIARSLFLTEAAQMRAKVQAHKVDPSNQKKLAQSLKARVAMLNDIEKAGARAVNSGDWTSQLVILDLLAKESGRFYEEVLSLPIPQGLSGEDEQQYLSLLSQQAAPHQIRSQDVGKKVSEFWSNESAIKQLGESVAAATGLQRKLVLQEAMALAEVAPEDKKQALVAITGKDTVGGGPSVAARPAITELEKARQVVRENPLDRTGLENLLGLERKLGRKPMISYLENRIQALGPDTGGGKL